VAFAIGPFALQFGWFTNPTLFKIIRSTVFSQSLLSL